jgi:hypothetical protein
MFMILAPNFYGNLTGTFQAADSGYYAFLKPLKRGTHTIIMHGVRGAIPEFGLPEFSTMSTYTIIVE